MYRCHRRGYGKSQPVKKLFTGICVAHFSLGLYQPSAKIDRQPRHTLNEIVIFFGHMERAHSLDLSLNRMQECTQLLKSLLNMQTMAIEIDRRDAGAAVNSVFAYVPFVPFLWHTNDKSGFCSSAHFCYRFHSILVHNCGSLVHTSAMPDKTGASFFFSRHFII